MPQKKADLTGQVFGRLTVLSRAGDDGNYISLWLCQCECGNQTTTRLTLLRNGTCQSCGCYKRERIIASSTTHGMTKSPEYKAWALIIVRCTNQNQACWKDFGGRGVTVADRWRDSFADFLADMGPMPSDGKRYVPERFPNPDGNFEPGNVRWTVGNTERHGKARTKEYTTWNSMKERCLNVNNKAYERYGARGVTVCPEWVESFEAFFAHVGPIPAGPEKYSLDRIDGTKGYEPGNVRWATKETQANNTRTNVFLTAFGKTQTIAQWSRETGIDRSLISQRIRFLGWSHERAVSEKAKHGPRKTGSKPEVVTRPSNHLPFTWPF